MSRRVADFECRYCKERVEAELTAAPDECANCGGPMKRLYATPGVTLKGKGWAGRQSR